MDRKLLKNIDIPLCVIVLTLVLIGLTAIFAATQTFSTERSMRFIMVQSIAFFLGLLGILIIIRIDYYQFGAHWKIIYVICILLLLSIYIPGLGVVNKGARRWIDLGFIELQTSELVKIGIVITFAKLLESREDRLNTLKDLMVPLAHVGVPIVLIMMQPDLGTALVFIVILVGMLFVAGMNLKFIYGGIAALLVSFPILWNFILFPHQKNRLITFINPHNDPLGEGYHVIQSMLAVGSGGITGKGLFAEDSLTHLNFLPEQWTDFIFSVIAELTGFIGASIVVILFFLFLFRLLYLSRIAKDQFGTLIITGIFCIYLFQIIENIGMTIGLMPVTGITLPFMSYGGSAMLTNMLAMGVVLNVTMRRHKIKF